MNNGGREGGGGQHQKRVSLTVEMFSAFAATLDLRRASCCRALFKRSTLIHSSW